FEGEDREIRLQVDESIRDFEELDRRVARCRSDLDAQAESLGAINEIGEVAIAADDDGDVDVRRLTQEIDRQFHIEIAFGRAVTEALEWLGDDAKAVAPEP